MGAPDDDVDGENAEDVSEDSSASDDHRPQVLQMKETTHRPGKRIRLMLRIVYEPEVSQEDGCSDECLGNTDHVVPRDVGSVEVFVVVGQVVDQGEAQADEQQELSDDTGRNPH